MDTLDKEKAPAEQNGKQGGKPKWKNKRRRRHHGNDKRKNETSAPGDEMREETLTPPEEKSTTFPEPPAPVIEEKADPAEEGHSEPERILYEVVGVKFKQGGKVYYFDPCGNSYEKDSHVIVDTARGIEYGTVSSTNKTVGAGEIVLPLRKVVRTASAEDEKRHEANAEKEVEAFNLCLSKIEEHRLDMKLVEVEYTFDNSKLLFYFTSEGRVDFRDLVKDLASVFKTRIELRQIGIRDEAKLMGGLGVCGRAFCCASFLPDFVQVSIKMAKEQNLSLNSSKISGACGRLMCCLRYEHEAYAEEIARTPKVDAIVSTPDGDGVVIEISPLKGLCKVALDRDPSKPVLFHRDDLKVKGHAKGRKKTSENEAQLDSELASLEDK